MRKMILPILILGILFCSVLPVVSQESNKQGEQEKTEETQAPPIKPEDLLKKSPPSYFSAGNRDPFWDLLAGAEVQDDESIKGISQMRIDDIILLGVVIIKGKFFAVISGPQTFPHSIEEGDRFADGFVQSIERDRVVFTQTKQRGLPLYRPRNIIKEIHTEER